MLAGGLTITEPLEVGEKILEEFETPNPRARWIRREEADEPFVGLAERAPWIDKPKRQREVYQRADVKRKTGFVLTDYIRLEVPISVTSDVVLTLNKELLGTKDTREVIRLVDEMALEFEDQEDVRLILVQLVDPDTDDPLTVAKQLESSPDVISAHVEVEQIHDPFNLVVHFESF